MANRTAAVIITIIAVFICGFPGLAAFCVGLFSMLDYAAGFGIFASDQRTYLSLIFGGLCVGIILILIAALVSFFVLRQKKETPPPPPPSTPEEPLPPTI